MDGFTLIELLLVLAIVSITAASAILYLVPDSLEHELERESYRLYQLLKLLEDEAIMQSTEYGVEVFNDGYRFMEFDYENNSWHVIDDERVYKPHQLAEGLFMVFDSQAVDLKIASGSKPESADKDLEISSEGIEDIANEDEASTPSIWVLSSGELTEFRIEIFKQDEEDQPFVILGYETGDLEIKTPYDE